MKIILLLGVGMALPFMAGCRSDGDYVTREEFMRGLQQTGDFRTVTSVEEAIKTQREMKEKIDELIKHALTAPAISERSAAILASADHAAGNLKQALQAVAVSMDVVTNNIANARTLGFKRLTARFEGGRLSAIVRDFGQGFLEATNRKLDLSIQGDGFFQVIMDSHGTVG